MEQNKDFLTYKGRPLVRNGNTLYYGNMSDKYVVQLTILETQKQGDIDVAKKVQVMLVHSDTEMNPLDRIVKKSEKNGLYEAMDIGAIWLDRELSK